MYEVAPMPNKEDTRPTILTITILQNMISSFKKNLRPLLSAVLLWTATAMPLAAQHYPFKMVKDDPTHTRIYTLNNGLKVYMSVNKDQPRLQTYIAVNTGSRNDPAETTGLAHYLEHLMFKGTNHFGSSNPTAERPLLDSIEHRFEVYRTIKDAQQRKKAYHEIDSISQLAARYNIPNEYDKMMAAIGSEGSNAYTSNDVTCYIENIPNNELDNWAKVQSDRFQNMVIRGFHTELEAVYEEYNKYLVRDNDKSWAALNRLLYPTHPYGTQTTIGTQEHLKNPSITNIKSYFSRYYVPNNVAICLSGDIDCDQTIALIDRYFGQWQKSTTLSRPEFSPQPDLTSPKDSTVWGEEAEYVLMGWKMAAAAQPQIDTLKVVADLLSNGKAGLFDLHLNQPAKVMNSGAFVEAMTDYSTFVLEAYPKEGQSLDEVKQLLLGEISRMKRGEFSNDLVASVVANLKLQFQKALHENRNRTELMKNAFIHHQSWEEAIHSIDRIQRLNKSDIVAFANKYLNDNYVCIYKRQGNDTTIHEMDKPSITPIPTNNDRQSDFLKAVIAAESTPIKPRFIDFNTDLTRSHSRHLPVLYKHNTEDDLFELTFYYPFGSESDRRLSAAVSYLNFIGTAKHSVAWYGEQFYQLACNYKIDVDDDETRITLSGLNEHMPQALALLEDLLAHAQPDTATYQRYVELELKARRDNKTNQGQNFEALFAYARQGEYNSFRNVMSEKELRQTNPATLTGLLAQLQSHRHQVLYYGPSTLKSLCQLIDRVHTTPRQLLPAPTAKLYQDQPTPQTEVLIAPYKAQNIYMAQYTNRNKMWTPDEAPMISLFNEYFGGGMNAIVFQELREARGLAYHASARYLQPQRKGGNESFYTLILTQNDKMMDCVHEFNTLLDSLPQRQAGFDLAKQSLRKSLATNRTNRMDIINAWIAAQKRGLNEDINKRIYEALPKIQLTDLIRFQQENIRKQPMKYIILGNEDALDMKALERIGQVKHLSTATIFGY